MCFVGLLNKPISVISASFTPHSSRVRGHELCDYVLEGAFELGFHFVTHQHQQHLQALEACLELVTRTTYETNTQFMTYVKNLEMSNCKTCESFARSSESYDPSWFTSEITADVRLLRAACQDPVFVASMQRLMQDDLAPEETYRRVEAALRARGMLDTHRSDDMLHRPRRDNQQSESGPESAAKCRRLSALLVRLREL